MRSRRFVSGALLVAAVAAIVGLYLSRQNIYDFWRLKNYSAPEQVAALADATAMNGTTRKIFYVNHPSIEDKATFNGHCRDNEQTIVLGCFIERKGIYLLKVDDPRLDGVEEVTAAHETLHAVYARLNSSERAHVDKMVNDAFATMHDEELQNTIDLYRKKDPSTVNNELHSILGTEIRKLPPDLEAHYAKYFTDRLKVVGFAEQYKQVFIDDRNQVIEYDAQLTALKGQIDSLQNSLDTQSSDLDQRRSQLNTYKAAGKYDQYNAAVPGYNAKVVAYNNDVNTLRSHISEYNDIVPKRNAIANEQQQLVSAIDSRDLNTETK